MFPSSRVPSKTPKLGVQRKKPTKCQSRAQQILINCKNKSDRWRFPIKAYRTFVGCTWGHGGRVTVVCKSCSWHSEPWSTMHVSSQGDAGPHGRLLKGGEPWLVIDPLYCLIFVDTRSKGDDTKKYDQQLEDTAILLVDSSI